MKSIFLFVFSLFSAFLFSQENKTRQAYKEDQFYLNSYFTIQTNSLPNFIENGFSYGFNLGFINDIFLTPSGHKAIGVGLGYGYSRMANNIEVQYRNVPQTRYVLPTSDSSLRNAFSYHQIQLPIELRWRTSTASSYSFWRVYLGYQLSYQFKSLYKPFFGRKVEIPSTLSPWQHALGLSLGYNTWNIRLTYVLTPIIDSSLRTIEGEGMDFHPLQIGLVFYFL